MPLEIELKSGVDWACEKTGSEPTVLKLMAPCLLPPLEDIAVVRVASERYYPVHAQRVERPGSRFIVGIGFLQNAGWRLSVRGSRVLQYREWSGKPTETRARVRWNVSYRDQIGDWKRDRILQRRKRAHIAARLLTRSRCALPRTPRTRPRSAASASTSHTPSPPSLLLGVCDLKHVRRSSVARDTSRTRKTRARAASLFFLEFGERDRVDLLCCLSDVREGLQRKRLTSHTKRSLKGGFLSLSPGTLSGSTARGQISRKRLVGKPLCERDSRYYTRLL